MYFVWVTPGAAAGGMDQAENRGEAVLDGKEIGILFSLR